MGVGGNNQVGVEHNGGRLGHEGGEMEVGGLALDVGNLHRMLSPPIAAGTSPLLTQTCTS